MTSYSINWATLGDLFIRNETLYNNIQFNFNENCLFDACMYGGPIAIATPSKSLKNLWNILIFTANAKLLSQIETSNINSIYWSRDQKLIVINPNGRVLLYTALGELLNNFDSGQETNEYGIVDAQIFPFDSGTGLAVFNKANNFYGFDSINNRALWRIQNSEKRIEPINCWAVISIPTKPTRIFFFSKNNFYLGQMQSTSELQTFNWSLNYGTYKAIKPSYDSLMVALAHNSGKVQIISGDLCSLLYNIDFVCKTNFSKTLIWCGLCAIATQNSTKSIEICEFVSNAKHNFNFYHPIYLGFENDGIRIFTSNFVNFLTPVPKSMIHAIGLTSSDPTALLFDASEKLEKKSASCDVYEYVKMIGDRMSNAVDECIIAAAHHFDPSMQKSLLKAASMGMVLCSRYNRSTFVEVVKKLRLLNAIRNFGMPLSFNQLEELSVESLINRLIALREWQMAIEICLFMRLDMEKGVLKVLAYWCRYSIDNYKKQLNSNLKNMNQQQLAQKIILRLNEYDGVSYADIAMEAAKKELNIVVNILLEKELNLTKQIDVLLKLKEMDKALAKAVNSQQPDLIHLVLNTIRKTKSESEFQLMLSKIPQALSLYQSSIYDETPERALILYKQNDDFIRQAIYYLERAELNYSLFDTNKLTEHLIEAGRIFNTMRDTQASQLVEQSVNLINEQLKMEETFTTTMVDKTLRETFIFLVSNDQLNIADSIKKQYKLDEKQYWLWMIEGFAIGKRWPQLEQFSRSKKSPVGYLPLIEICCKYKNKAMTERFMDKITSYEDQIKAYLYMNEPTKAAQLAAEKIDMNMLQSIRRKLQVNSSEWLKVTEIIDSLDKKGF